MCILIRILIYSCSSNMSQDKLEALSASIVCFLFHICILTGISLSVYLTIFTDYWYIVILYYIWVLYIDKDTPERDGRPSEWFKSLSLFKYARNYFPVQVHLVPGFNIDPNTNYMSCLFPHGFATAGAVIGFTTNACGIRKVFPNHTIYASTLDVLFNFPVIREYALSLGLVRASAKSIGHVLSRKEGSTILGLVVGGTSEMFYCNDGQYRLTLLNRKGFAKVALMHGAPIIPVFIFGETSIWKQKVFPEGTLARKLINLTKRWIGFPLVAIYGRGWLLGEMGLIPIKQPLNVLIGQPFDIPKISNPTQEEIDVVHQKLIKELTKMFEEYKYKFESDPENSKLTIA